MLSVKNLSQKLVIYIIICLGFVVLLPVSAVAAGHPQEPVGEIIVKYKSSVSPGQMIVFGLSHGTANVKTVGEIKVQEVEITDGSSVSKKLNELKKDSSIEYAEPNYKRQAQITTPNDTYYYSHQWNLPKIQADYAWDIQRGNSNVIIAIVDTGVSLNHPDLSGKIVAGYDSVSHDGNPTDENGHGTHVAGIASATTNNGVGVAGVSWNSRIMPVRVLDASGNGWDSDIAEGIIWAADNGAKVINMSLGGPSSYPQTLQNAVNYAYAHGVTLVAAAGNNPNGEITYPAACVNVIGVAATDINDARASFSNYGTFVDVAAPGVSIASSYWTASVGNTYGTGSGTSMATPHVAGLASLVLAQYPSATPAQIETAIESTAVDLGTPGRDNYYGYGRIDVLAALMPVDHFTVSTPGSQIAGTPFSFTVTAKDGANNTVTAFNENVTITDTSGSVSPTATGSFTGGVWTGNITVTKITGTDVITVMYNGGKTGSSGAFAVNPNVLHHIVVSPTVGQLRVSQILDFSAKGYDAWSNEIAGLVFNWTSTGGTVSPATGVTQTTYSAGIVGGSAFSVTAANGGVVESAQVIVYSKGDDVSVYRYGSYPNWFAKLSTGNDFGGESRPLSWGNAGGDTPFVGDFDDNGVDDLGVYRYGSYPNWFVNLSQDDGGGFGKGTKELSWGNPGGDTPIVGDFDGDGNDDIGVYRYGSYPNWFILLADPSQLSGFRPANEAWSLSWGNPGGDTPIVGDFDGDGKDDIGVYRYGSYPNWFTKVSGASDIRTGSTRSLSWGNPGGDTPIVGDFDGDLDSDIGVYRYGSYPNWFTLMADPGETSGFRPAGETWFLAWGNPGGDTPIVGDFDGDAKDDIGVYRYGSYPNWFAKVSNNGDFRTGPAWSLYWGNPGGDTPIIGDFNGDSPLAP